MGINILPSKLQPSYYSVENNHNAYKVNVIALSL